MDGMDEMAPLVVSRRFAAPRALVFEAWSSAAHMQRWFCPEGMDVPVAEVDFRPGGACVICMRAPDGQEFWSRGAYIEVSPPERLVFESAVEIGGVARFSAHTTVDFAVDGMGTLMSVRQVYTIHDPAFAAAPAGAEEGWRTTLDKLEREVGRILADPPRSVAHDSFTLERALRAAPALVFRAFTDAAAKAAWFGYGDGLTVLKRELDVRPGGREHLAGRWANGTVSEFDAVYLDVIADRRLVYAYEMHIDGRKISASLATVEMHDAAGGGTRLVVTEQGAFLDGYEDAGARAHGTGMLLDRLVVSLGG